MYEVPAGTKPSTCTGKKKGGVCTAVVYWIEYPGVDRKTKQPKTIRQPVDCVPSPSFPDARAPTATAAGLGVSHYLTCPDVKKF